MELLVKNGLVITMDGDGSYPPEEIPRLVERDHDGGPLWQAASASLKD